MMKLLRSPALSCLVLGALAACGFAPLQLWPLTLLCLAIWMMLVARAPSVRGALWRGYAFGVGHFTVNDNWFQHAFDFQDKMPPVLGYFAAVALALYLAMYPAMAAGVAWRFRGRTGVDMPFVLVFAAAWIATEWLRATVFTGYAWDPIGVIWVPVQGAAALAAWVGTYALSGLTIVVAGRIAQIVRNRRRGETAALLVVLAMTLFWQWRSYPMPAASPAPTTARVRVVQPNIGNEDRGVNGGELALAALIRGSGTPGPAPRLVVWPEGLLTDFLEDGYPPYAYQGRPSWVVRGLIARALGPRDVVMTSGDTLRFDRQDAIVGAGNSVLAIDAGGDIVGRYDKAHLVPYGEYLPMPWLLRPLGLARLVPGDMDFDPGPGPRTLALPGFGPVAVQVCYEIVFSGEVVDRAHRPRLLFNPSNDAWFGTWGPPQHLAQARMRAIEEGLPIVRATPTGVSAIIAADGRLVATVPSGQAGAIEAPLPPALPPTLFARFGNLLAAIVGAALFASGVAMRRRQR